MSRRLLIALAAVAAGIGAAWIELTSTIAGDNVPTAVIALVVGWSYVACGLVAWRQRPGNPLGPVMLAIGFALMGELKFFIPFKLVIWRAYSAYILSYCGLLFANLFAAAFALNRKFFLKDTGRKLAHLDKQFNAGQSEVPAEVPDEE